MPKRSTKWYRKNERETMEELGFRSTKNSGSGWIEKGDGCDDDFQVELKTTEKTSYSVRLFDLEKLGHEAAVAGKMPLFILDFYQKEKFAIFPLDKLRDVAIIYGCDEGAEEKPPVDFRVIGFAQNHEPAAMQSVAVRTSDPEDRKEERDEYQSRFKKAKNAR